jgi:hypothetical protein
MGPGDKKATPNNRPLNFLDLWWSAVGASAAIALTLWFSGGSGAPFRLFSLGGSTVSLFALTGAEAPNRVPYSGDILVGLWLAFFVPRFSVMRFGFPF